ncbi:unnamed protein product [Closterium sp. NIES-54]
MPCQALLRAWSTYPPSHCTIGTRLPFLLIRLVLFFPLTTPLLPNRQLPPPLSPAALPWSGVWIMKYQPSPGDLRNKTLADPRPPYPLPSSLPSSLSPSPTTTRSLPSSVDRLYTQCPLSSTLIRKYVLHPPLL